MEINHCSELECPWQEEGKCKFTGTEGCIFFCTAEKVREYQEKLREGGERCI